MAPTTNEAKTVGWVIEQLVQAWRSGAKWSLDGQQHPHEASYLRLDHSKARSRLDWRPRWGIGQTIEKIVEWHKAYDQRAYMHETKLSKISSFQTY